MSATLAGAGAPSDAGGGVARRVAFACSGPSLIVILVLFALRGFASRPLLTAEHVDILSFWLPRFAFLGRSLASGHVPLWNPFEMAGYRFAADPQSGWLYAPAMLLFSSLSPGAAIRALIVANPMLGGLGLYAFCRRDGLSRVASTAAGLSTSMIVATSEMAISLPFAGTLAWTPIVLLGAAGYRLADRWSRRFAWLALAGFGWSQVAGAHMSHGLVACTLIVGAYLIAGAAADVRARRIKAAAAAGRTALFLLAMPMAGLPVLLPRLSFIAASSLHAGYGAVADVGKGSSAGQDAPLAAGGIWAGWPLSFAVSPGPYAGAAILIAAPLALRARRRRHLAWAFGLSLAITYVSTLDLLLARRWFQSLVLKIPFGDVYIHNPGRFRYVAVIALPVLGAVGIQGLLDDPPTRRKALGWLAIGPALWLALPLAAGGIPGRFTLLGAGSLAALILLFLLATRRRAWVPAAVVGLLALELLTSAAWSQRTPPGRLISSGLEPNGGLELMPQPLTPPAVSQAEFMRPTPFAAILEGTADRYLTYAPPASSFDKGYLFAQRPQDWPGLTMERGTLFGIHDSLGYNPVQMPRYWSYIRATDPLPVFYNASVINDPSLQDVRLLGVRYLVVPAGVETPLPGTVVAQDGGYNLVEIDGWEPRVSVVSFWSVAAGPDAALESVNRAGFDPAQTVVLERDPHISSGSTTGASPATATYSETTPENVTVLVDAPSPSIVVVRTSYDPGWSATVDGRPAPVLAADFLLQGVAVGTGHHRIELTYHDARITWGLRAGIALWLLLLAGIFVAAVVERGRGRGGGPESSSPRGVEEGLRQDGLAQPASSDAP